MEIKGAEHHGVSGSGLRNTDSLEVEHSPLPWHVGERYHQYGPPLLTPDDVTVTHVYGSESVSDSGDEANAEYIVKACNSHEALVAAATKVLAGLNARIDLARAQGSKVPVFDGIADLFSALSLADE